MDLDDTSPKVNGPPVYFTLFEILDPNPPYQIESMQRKNDMNKMHAKLVLYFCFSKNILNALTEEEE